MKSLCARSCGFCKVSQNPLPDETNPTNGPAQNGPSKQTPNGPVVPIGQSNPLPYDNGHWALAKRYIV
ncbi:hypothetical protein AAVH_41159, partial [Aphelenchoides avenae]